MIEGEIYFDRKEDLKRRELLAREKRDLIEREKKAPQQTQPTQPIPTISPALTEEELDGHPFERKERENQ